MQVTETVGPAWERMKAMLFRPFNIGTWFTFGFIFTLQSCVEGGGGNSFNVPNGNSGSSSTHHTTTTPHGDDTNNAIGRFAHDLLGSLTHGMSNATHASVSRGAGGDDFDFSQIDFSTVLPFVIIAIIIAIPILFLMYWLGARGQMMSIRSVALGRADIGESWRETSRTGSALFKFHMVVFGLAALVFVPLLGGGGVMTWSALQATDGRDADAKLAVALPIIIAFVVIAMILAIPFAVLNGLARNFVAPIMLKHEIGSREAWKRFWAIGKDSIGRIFLFFVLKVLVSGAAGIVAVIGGFLTCCLGFFPVLHQTLMAPYYVFERAWTLEILASMSPDFDLRANANQGGPQGGFGVPPGFSGGGYYPGYNPYAPPGAGGPPGGAPPPGGFGGGGFGGGPGGYGPGGGGGYGPPA